MNPLILALVAAFTLAGCGADGAPTAPAAKSGVSVSGDLQIGVTG